MSTFEYSEQFSAPQLGRRCLLFILEMYDETIKLYDNPKDRQFYFDCLRRMVPCLRDSLYCGAGPIWDNSATGTAGGGTSSGGDALPIVAHASGLAQAAAAAGDQGRSPWAAAGPRTLPR